MRKDPIKERYLGLFFVCDRLFLKSISDIGGIVKEHSLSVVVWINKWPQP